MIKVMHSKKYTGRLEFTIIGHSVGRQSVQYTDITESNAELFEISLDLSRNLINCLNRETSSTQDPLSINTDDRDSGMIKFQFTLIHIEGVVPVSENPELTPSDISFSFSVPEERIENSMMYRGDPREIPVETGRQTIR